MKYIFLTKKFYETYDCVNCPEILHKEGRPYIMLLVEIEGCTFAIPLRSHLRHQHGFITDKETGSGLDFSKAVVITTEEHITSQRKIVIKENENTLIVTRKAVIIQRFHSYVNRYKKNVRKGVYKTHRNLSTLQYFHKELGLE